MSWAVRPAPVLLRRHQPATAANIARNAAGAGDGRAQRWESARQAAWRLLERHVPANAQVAVIGAGNGDDLPLALLARGAARLDLFDLDPSALRRARRACPPTVRDRVRLHRLDVTAGVADAIAHAARHGRSPRSCAPPDGPIGAGGYDVVIGDLFYTQTLYPALLDAGLPPAATRRLLALHGPRLTDAVVSRMHASLAPHGRAIHLHDIVGWWDGHPQPVSLQQILAQARLHDAFALISRCRRPVAIDPRQSACRRGAQVLDTALWEWPFAPGASYLVCATVTDGRIDR